MSRILNGTATDHLDGTGTAVSAAPMSFCIWVRSNALTTQMVPITLGSSGISTQRWGIIQFATGIPAAQAFDATASNVSAGGAIPDASWHCLVGTYNADSTNKAMYLDALLKGTGGVLKNPVQVTPVTALGRTPNGANFWNGSLAHAAVWNIQLADADVAQLMTLPPSQVQKANLVDYWPLRGGGATEPSYGSVGTVLTVSGTTFSTDDPYPSFEYPLESTDYF